MAEITNQQVIAGLANALSPRVPEWYGRGATLRPEAAALRAYPYSFFLSFPVQTMNGEDTLLAKIHRKPHIVTLNDALTTGWLKPIAHDEYEMAQQIWRAFEAENSSAFTAVEPLGFMDEWNAILMRKVEGKPLKKYLLSASVALRSPHALKRLQELLKASVIWLRIFHQRVAGAQDTAFPAQDASDTMDEVLSKLSRHSKGEVDVETYRYALSNHLTNLDAGTVQVPVALLHDDFQYSNILIMPDGRVCVVDYALNHRGCVYADLATIIIDPQTRGAQIWTSGRLIDPGFIHACQQTILDAYFNGASYHKKALDFYCALAVLNKWSADEAEVYHGWRKQVYSPLSASTRRYYAKLLEQYL